LAKSDSQPAKQSVDWEKEFEMVYYENL